MWHAIFAGTLALCLFTGCSADRGGITDPAVVAADSVAFLITPPGYPESDAVLVTQPAHGYSKLVRDAQAPKLEARIEDQTPGHVLIFMTVTFNYPQHCREGEDRLPVQGPCRGNGPADRRDGDIPEVRVSADMWAGTVVGEDGAATISIDLATDAPVQRINEGPGLLNPEGAVVFVFVMDKGPVVPEGMLRGIQLNTAYGGCQGPPAFGTLECRGVAIAQHLPPKS